MTSIQPQSPIIVALDFANLDDALKLANQLDPSQCRVKVGKELFTVSGPKSVRALQDLGFEVFLDLKFHDIPNTMAQAVLAAANLGVWMVNVHAMAGRRALTQCAQRLQQSGLHTKLIAVTVLTSMDDAELREVNIAKPIHEQVSHLAQLSEACGLHGVVCSANEAKALRATCADDFLLVTPGIRMKEDAANDQSRICLPSDALDNGASYLVVGRSITQSDNPKQKLESILTTL